MYGLTDDFRWVCVGGLWLGLWMLALFIGWMVRVFVCVCVCLFDSIVMCIDCSDYEWR